MSAYDIGAFEVFVAGVFLQQPQDARIYSGDTHDFTVAVVDGGCALTYQWKWDDGSTTQDVGADAPTLNLPM